MPIPGLPNNLPEPALRYAEALPKGRFTAFPLTSLDRTGVPVWEVSLFLDNAADFPGAMPSGFGYGTTDGEALIGAIAEMAEMICPTMRLIGERQWHGSYNDLLRKVSPTGITNPLTLCLPAGSPVGRDTPLAWIAATRARTGEPVLVPMDVGALDYFELPHGYQPFTPLITNGLGAGPDLDWAIGHGLLECLQRDGNGLLFRALDQGILLDLSEDLEPETRALLDRLNSLSIEVQAKYATDEFGLANLYVVGFEREGHEPPVPIMLSACGEACDPDRERALRKALLEFCSARVRKSYSHGPRAVAAKVTPPGYIDEFLRTAAVSLEGGESRALTAMLDWAQMDTDQLRQALSTVFSERSRKSFKELPATPLGDTRERGRYARECLEAQGFDVLYVDCSPRDKSIGVVKVIVPGLEVETMSYYRIGERNTRKLVERNSPLIRFGEPTETLRPVRLTAEALDRLGGRQPLLDIAAVDATVGPLYPLYREPEAHHVAQILQGRAIA
jgi:ribosomal protein S12 methylthiotransferase accessory factor